MKAYFREVFRIALVLGALGGLAYLWLGALESQGNWRWLVATFVYAVLIIAAFMRIAGGDHR